MSFLLQDDFCQYQGGLEVSHVCLAGGNNSLTSKPFSFTHRRHVFGDLRPYTCLFQGCTESNADFDRRHLWHAHISQYHWRSWSCPFKCDGGGSFPTASELKSHLRYHHMPNAPKEQLDGVTALGGKAATKDTTTTCSVCGHTVVGLRPYIKHVGRHLEQLALFALPRVEDEAENDTEGDQESDDERNGTNSRIDSDDHDAQVCLLVCP